MSLLTFSMDSPWKMFHQLSTLASQQKHSELGRPHQQHLLQSKQALGLLRCILKISASNIKEKAYKVFIRPLLEFAASVWDPYSQKNIAKIEAVQRRAAHFALSQFRNISSVNNMLEALGWPTLEHWRQTCRLLMLYKIQSGLAHCPTLKAKLVPLPSRQWCTHDKQLTLLTTRTQHRGSSFLPKTIRDWNLLPIKVVGAPTLDAFESRVSNWKTTYSIPPPPPT